MKIIYPYNYIFIIFVKVKISWFWTVAIFYCELVII